MKKRSPLPPSASFPMGGFVGLQVFPPSCVTLTELRPPAMKAVVPDIAATSLRYPGVSSSTAQGGYVVEVTTGGHELPWTQSRPPSTERKTDLSWFPALGGPAQASHRVWSKPWLRDSAQPP